MPKKEKELNGKLVNKIIIILEKKKSDLTVAEETFMSFCIEMYIEEVNEALDIVLNLRGIFND